MLAENVFQSQLWEKVAEKAYPSRLRRIIVK